ncbi:MAG: hypothetical protein ACLRPX_11140, partial [Ruthenibacterium sp.]
DGLGDAGALAASLGAADEAGEEACEDAPLCDAEEEEEETGTSSCFFSACCADCASHGVVSSPSMRLWVLPVPKCVIMLFTAKKLAVAAPAITSVSAR